MSTRKIYIMQLKKIPLLVTNKIEELINLKKDFVYLEEKLDKVVETNYTLEDRIIELEKSLDEERKINNENVIIYEKKLDHMSNDMSIMVAALKELYVNVDHLIKSVSFGADPFGFNSGIDDEEGH